MTRGVQKTDEEKLQALDDQIAELADRKDKIQFKIDDLNQQKQSILDEQNHKKLEEIQKLITESGRTPDEILAILKGEQVIPL